MRIGYSCQDRGRETACTKQNCERYHTTDARINTKSQTKKQTNLTYRIIHHTKMVRHVYCILAAGVLVTWRATADAYALSFSDCSTSDNCMSYDDGTETYCSTSSTCRDTWKAGCFCVSGSMCVNILQTVTTLYNPYTGTSSESDEDVENITSLEGCDYFTLGYDSDEKKSMCHSLCDGVLSYSTSPECAIGRYVDKTKVYYLPEEPCADLQAGTCDLATNAGGLLSCLETAQRVYSYCIVTDADTTGIEATCGALDRRGDLFTGPILSMNSTSSLCDPENITTTYFVFTTTDGLCGLSLRVDYHSRVVGEGEVAMCGNTIIQTGGSASYSEVYSALAQDCTGLLAQTTNVVPLTDLQTACADVCTNTDEKVPSSLDGNDRGDSKPSCATTVLSYPHVWVIAFSLMAVRCVLGLLLLQANWA